MGSLFEDIRDGIRDGIEFVADKTDEYTKIGKIKVEILNIKRNIEKQFTELGGRTYELVGETGSTHIADDVEIKRLVEEIKALEVKLDEKKDQIKVIKEEKERQRKERENARREKAESQANAPLDEDKDVSEQRNM